MITLLSGTNRPGSNTRLITGILESLYTKAGIPCQVLDLADLPAEIFSPASYAEKPASFAPFAETILASDGVVIVTPEYNGSFPGVLKYFVDMLPFPESFENRPVCLVGLAAGMWGALRSVEQLQVILGYRNAHVFPARVFIPGVNKVLKDGQIQDPALLQRLQDQATGFASFVASLKA
ncbi:NAD(P)H-dependent oxidoreductase [Prosthecobacter sp. SYSU 5D2]|uniref:NADPH-dependent FMN reductase n=1 Tax=Prosthecobacter sp. SYSU 5D2 TaxID=3134134 RepID=UPI0031FE6A0E